MQVSVENSGKLGRTMRVELPESKVIDAVSERLQSIKKTTKVAGFRPGKVPMNVIQKRYGDVARKEVVGEIVQSSFYEALQQEKIQPAGRPSIDEVNDEPGKDLVFVATFEVLPEIELPKLDKLKIERPICDVSDTDIDNMIETLRKQRQTHEEADKKAEQGDMVNINFEGFKDDEAFDGGKADNYELELGKNQFIAGFEEGLVGYKAGDDLELSLTFPEDYGNEALAGQDVVFKVHVNSVNQVVLPEIDDEFIKEFGVEDGDVAKFRDEIKSNILREVESVSKREIKNNAFDAVSEATEVEVPNSMVDMEIDRMKEQLRQNFQQQGVPPNTVDSMPGENFEEQARKRVALQLIVQELIKQNELKSDPAKVRMMIEDVASSYQDPAAVINWYYSDQKNIAEVEGLVLEDSVIDHILNSAKVTDKAYPFDELINKGQTANA